MRRSWRLCQAGMPAQFDLIRRLADTRSKTITLGQLMRSTDSEPEALVRSGRWLHVQLPIRLARRLDEFVQLPYVAVKNPRLARVLEIYHDTFEVVHGFPQIATREDEAAFCKVLHDRFAKHKVVAQLIAEGYRDVRQLYPAICLDDFLNKLFIAHISQRILTENYILMRKPRPGYIGVVQQRLRPAAILSNLTPQLRSLTKLLYGFAPEVEMRGNLSASLDYIPGHVSFMCRELLKNALRSTAERHGERRHLSGVPPVVVELQKGDVHIIIKISDQGGGMSKDVQREAWHFGWSSVATLFDQPEGEDASKALAGFGFGLPLTRIFAQYFGGDVFMQALPGHGTDMYLLLNHLKEGTHATEGDDPSTSLVAGENFVGDSKHSAP